ncbi:hypothetical protein CVT24_004753 [Panaeolus cyanescens]|uniref:Uncharacterized protein n=1 Tax=Panaeolus cyanescens TaxID=181874 RepID=A0A409VD70_9AGAR|nr:hypothetical protein CVT24_004753 [Panaeolus cyanescens]
MNSYSPSSNPEDMRRLLSSAQTVLEQPPPPSLREILTAYRTKGDGDRDMLLSMLNAKTAEDQRMSSVANLHRTMLEIYQHAPAESTHSYSRSTNGSYHYPTPSFTHSPRPQDMPSRRPSHRHRASSRSRSPPRVQTHLSSTRDALSSHHSDYPRKRHRSSRSPHLSHPSPYETSHPSEQFPPSPYSASERSDSAEYSPRSRASMTIGSLLSAGPNGDVPPQDRD